MRWIGTFHRPAGVHGGPAGFFSGQSSVASGQSLEFRVYAALLESRVKSRVASMEFRV